MPKDRAKAVQRQLRYMANGGDLVRASRRVVQREIIRQAKDHPCADCGGEFPYYVMDFDHVRGEKSFTLGKVLSHNPSPDRLAAEIAKCDVVCANCHRIRTHGAPEPA